MNRRIVLISLLLCIMILLSSCAPTPPKVEDTGTGASAQTQQQTNPGEENTLEDVAPPSSEELDALRYAYEPIISDEMPVIKIDSLRGSNWFITGPDRDYKLQYEIPYEDCIITVRDCEEEYQLNNVRAQVKARGNYTLNYPKKGIRIKFEEKQPMLGINDGAECKSWVLFANWKDLSNLNNAVAFYLGNKILGSDGYFCTDFRFAELYINGIYWGVYLVGEQHQVNENRIDVPEVEENYTGTDIGYFVEYDSYYVHELPEIGGNPTFTMSHHKNASLKMGNGSSTKPGTNGYTIQSDIYSQKQIDYVRDYMDLVYSIVYNACYLDKYYELLPDYTGMQPINDKNITQKEVVEQVLDLQSLVDFYILHEITCDPDLPRHSMFISMDLTYGGDNRLTFECPWDFDSALGIKTMGNANGLYAANSANPWILLVLNEPWFQEMVREKWAEICKYEVIEDAMRMAEKVTVMYEQNFIENYEKWPTRITGGNGELYDILNTYTTQKQASDYLIDWMTKRYSFLNSVWSTVQEPPQELEGREDYPAGGTLYRYEVEDAEVTGGIWIKNGWEASGATNGYAGNVSGGAGKEMIFTVNAEKSCEAFLIIGLSKRDFPSTLNGWFAVEINGAKFNLPSRVIPEISEGESSFHAWIPVDAMTVPLKKGANTVTLYTVAGDATNVDYIEFLSITPLS